MRFTEVICYWAVVLLCFAGCSVERQTMKVKGESLVLAKTEPGMLCFDQIVRGSVIVRSNFDPAKENTIVYLEGRDYVVDYKAGAIQRTEDSRIPDFSTNCLYKQHDFKHEQFPGYGNHKWFVWVDYETTNGQPWANPNDQTKFLTRVKTKLDAGGRFRIVSYGDSITAGGEASEPRFRFTQRFAEYLRGRFPKAQIETEDVSIPGYTSQQGVDWFDMKPQALQPMATMGAVYKPDLVLVGFGMNDHNIEGVELHQFQTNLIRIVEMIRERHDADVILFSSFPPNDEWHYGSHRMVEYAAATKKAAEVAKCAYADVYGVWEKVLRRKDQPSLLGNNINHPNDFGHWLYAQAFEALGL